MKAYRFRGKHIIDNKWVYGSLVTGGLFGEDMDKCWIFVSGIGVFLEVKAETVGMWIGLKDKNGIDIYDGDIITHERKSRPHSKYAKTTKVTCRVQWDTGLTEGEGKDNPSSFNREPGFAAYPVDRNAKGADWGYDWSEFHNCEIIGNIYEVKPAVKDSVTHTMNNLDPNNTQAAPANQEAIAEQVAAGQEQANAAESAAQDAAVGATEE